MAEDNEPEGVRVVHKRAEGYDLVPATGARGGFQPAGGYKMDFVVDYNQDPEWESVEVVEGRMGPQLEIEGEPAVIREKQVGVLLSEESAFSVATWTIANIISALKGEEITNEDIVEALEDQFDLSEVNPDD